MFQNSFQNGNYFQLYDPKIAQDKQKNLFKIVNISNLANTKIFDKQLKTYVLELRTSNAKIVFPKEDKKDLYLIQQYIVFQIYFFHSQPWSMQLVISDLNKYKILLKKTKRRIMLSSTNHKLEIKPFFVKSPCPNWKQGCWNNFAIDLYSFIEAFKGQTYRCLDSITIMGHFRLRRIYTTNMMPQNDQLQSEQSIKEINLLPKNFYFPPDIQQSSMLTRYNGETLSQLNLYEPTQPSTKNNSSYLKSTKNNRMSTPKTQATKSQKIVQVNSSLHTNNSIKIEKKEQERFLANTNGPEMLNRMRKRQKYVESSDSQSQMTDNVNTPQSTQKGDIKSNKKLIKTQIMPPKARTSVQRRPKPINIEQKKEKEKLKSKLNPWRTNIKPQAQSRASNKKNESDLQQQCQSPNTTSKATNVKKNSTNPFKPSISKGFDRKSDHYSESQYIELSQKFSTLTDGKFFNRNNNMSHREEGKNVNNSSVDKKHDQLQENTQQIEENIQMQSNSIYSPSNEKEYPKYERSKLSPQKMPQLINESICDSLDRRSPAKDFEQFGKQSYYGFADRLMNEYMRQKQRPYSPPMREKQYTEEQELTMQQRQVDKDKQVELVYDPVLNCYYDHKTHTYYELKN